MSECIEIEFPLNQCQCLIELKLSVLQTNDKV
jgi:hypothetical protein